MVLPWPGSSACSAPSPKAMNAAVMRNQQLRLRAVISSVNALRGVACWLAWRCRGVRGCEAIVCRPGSRLTRLACDDSLFAPACGVRRRDRPSGDRSVERQLADWHDSAILGAQPD